jgi:hypothetical protein
VDNSSASGHVGQAAEEPPDPVFPEPDLPDVLFEDSAFFAGLPVLLASLELELVLDADFSELPEPPSEDVLELEPLESPPLVVPDPLADAAAVLGSLPRESLR